MQLSGEEYVRVSEAYFSSDTERINKMETITTARNTFSTQGIMQQDAAELAHTVEAVAQVPETREQVITSLRAQIESGNYHVTGEQIAEMMVRRYLVDQYR